MKMEHNITKISFTHKKKKTQTFRVNILYLLMQIKKKKFHTQSIEQHLNIISDKFHADKVKQSKVTGSMGTRSAVHLRFLTFKTHFISLLRLCKYLFRRNTTDGCSSLSTNTLCSAV